MDRKSVLVIDPDRQWSKELRVALERSGWNALRPVYNGEDALTFIDVFRPDVIITEMLLDEYDGLYLVVYIRTFMSDYNPLIYVLSGISTRNLIKSIQIISESWDSIHIAKKPQSVQCVIKNIDFLTKEHPTPAPQFTSRLPLKLDDILCEIDHQIENFLLRLDQRQFLKSFTAAKTAIRLLMIERAEIPGSGALCQRIAEQVGGTKVSAERNLRSFRESERVCSSDYYVENLSGYNSDNSTFYWRAVQLIEAGLSDEIIQYLWKRKR